MSDHPPGLDAIRAAAARIAPNVHRTPVFRCAALDALCGGTLFFKAENLQRTGSFKARGACNAVFSLVDAQAARGVVTHSSGNHGQALAYAARARGVPAWVVMPTTAPAVKRAAVLGYGAEVVPCAPNLFDRETTAARVVADKGARLVHPYDDHVIIAGQATAALELLDEVPDLEALVAPVGGGGLLSGCALVAHALNPGVRVYGAEPSGADDTRRSLAAGCRILPESPHSVADGLLTALGERNFPILLEHVAAIAVVDDEAILAAMRLVWERLKLDVEPSGAVPLAALLSGQLPVAGAKVGVILTGGNVDLDKRYW